MFTVQTAKLAAVLAAIITGLVVPLSMLLESAPTSEEAAAGFNDLNPTRAEILATGLGVLLFFTVIFVIAGFVISRMSHKSSRE